MLSKTTALRLNSTSAATLTGRTPNTCMSQRQGMSSRGGQRMGGQEILVELLAGTIAASLAGLALHFSFKLLDPNRASRESAAARKKEIARRLGRPNIVTNQYEDIIAGDVANPHEITTTFDQIGGLGETKRALQEIVILPLLRPELFASGNLLRPVKGCMLYGPPGTGKTLLAKALAKECRACFINVRCSTLQSKWFGDANKLVAAVFSLAWKLQPSIIFIDEVDSFLGSRKTSEHEANTSMKTEFMTMWDGFQTNEHARVMVLAATNRPWEVDDAILRRLPRSFEVGLPSFEQRVDILSVILKNENLEPGFLSQSANSPVNQIAKATERYSGSDLKELCKEAAYGPIRDLLREEQRAEIERHVARVEKAVVKGLGGSGVGKGPTVGPGVDDLDGEDDIFFEADSGKKQKRPMTLGDFASVLAKSGTSADMAAKYRHQDHSRRVDRDQRAHSQFNGIGGAGDGRVQLDPEILKMVQAMMGAQGGGTPNQNELQVTPEMLQKMMEQFMVQRARGAEGGGGGSKGE